MIKYTLPAAIAALALGAPVLASAQVAQPMPMANPTNPTLSDTATTTTITTQQQYGRDASAGANQGDVLPGQQMMAPPSDMAPLVAAPVPPGAVWIPGQYNWDAAAGNYVWTPGQFAIQPHPNAQWVAGHWQQTPTSWIWLDGRWD